MGAVKSITHTYTTNEYLFWYIEKNDISKIEQLLNDQPQLINQNLSLNFKSTWGRCLEYGETDVVIAL